MKIKNRYLTSKEIITYTCDICNKKSRDFMIAIGSLNSNKHVCYDCQMSTVNAIR